LRGVGIVGGTLGGGVGKKYSPNIFPLFSLIKAERFAVYKLNPSKGIQKKSGDLLKRKKAVLRGG